MGIRTYRSINPDNGELFAEFDDHDESAVEKALGLLELGADGLKSLSISERSQLLHKLASILSDRASEYAKLSALEMGKPLAQGVSEVTKCSTALTYFALQGGSFLEPENRESDRGVAQVRFDPLGPILAIMPWNFPFWQVLRVLGPALLAGNPVLLKHAPNVPQCALAIERACREAGIGPEFFSTLFVSTDRTKEIILDNRIRGVTLTGSVGAGRKVGTIAGGAIKPFVLELGGSDPFIVLADADIDTAVREGVSARCMNNGQVCISPKRFLVARSSYRQFTEQFVELMRKRRVGSPMGEETENGPMARSDLRDELKAQVQKSMQMGAKLLCGFESVPERGNFIAPIVLVDVQKDSPAYKEELFGPVATLIPFDSEEEAIAIANDTLFGLGASVWSKDEERALRLVPKIDAGCIFINETVKSDPHLPFGGVKNSGFGRELSKEGLRQFTNIKSIRVARG